MISLLLFIFLSAPGKPSPDVAPKSSKGAPGKVKEDQGVAKLKPAPPSRSAAQQMPSLMGANGLYRLWSADPGLESSIRLKISLFTFESDDFPLKGAQNQYTATALSLAWSPLSFLEAFGSVRNSSNLNNQSRPELIQTQGDLSLGFKLGYFLRPDMALGFGAATHLISGLGEGGDRQRQL